KFYRTAGIKSAIILHTGSKYQEDSEEYDAERYVKKFDTRQHLIVMLFGVIEGYHSIRELFIWMLNNAHKLVYMGIDYMIRRSTLSDANDRRKSAVFGDIYMSVYAKHCESLPDSRKKQLANYHIAKYYWALSIDELFCLRRWQTSIF
ncbi:MAG: DUF4372 domain-containing protein, partial [Bacteroidales bacterium]|nr:DUF4372 domain-containing protein [Bacteroidales bacterium]